MTLQADVAVVGYGPTGAVLSHALASYGWTVAAFDREPEVIGLPRAVHFDAEVMRVFQQLRMADEVLPTTIPVRGMEMLNAQGEMIFCYDAPQDVGPLGWQGGFMFNQPELERTLRKKASTYPSLQVHLGTSVRDIRDEANGMVLQQDNGPGSRTTRARFVVGCDGGQSTVRAILSDKMFDYGEHRTWLVVDVLVEKDAGLPRVTVQYCDPARPATFVPLPGRRRRFEIMLMPGDTAESITAPGRVTDLLSRWLPPSSYSVERCAAYTFHCLVADRWRRGGLLIAGDAAHQMPPFLGQGLCSGIRDAMNLSWKLDLILRGVASTSLLDSYQDEREAHVRHLIEVDIELGNIIQTTDPAVAAQRDSAARASGAPTMLANFVPEIGGKLCVGTDYARRPFPQPRCPNGQRHDELLGGGFALVGAVEPSRWATQVLHQLGGHHVRTVHPQVRDWLDEADAEAAIVRPDRIVLGLAKNADDLDDVLTPLASHLTPC
ncbi:MAG: bifunctional 3-(3-hydroxy-phenyl)propionate/3-hydroxycinnamic acid hydroxylase [Myxococcales bacterium]|nr:bifunctional 3-(3-hydroxy-phenyl)propionate/3-hydroxycinnamic acid hydroxylase [Myxococcales bacterium]